MDPPRIQNTRSLAPNFDEDDAARVPSKRRDCTNSWWTNFRGLFLQSLSDKRANLIIVLLSMSGCIIDSLFFYAPVMDHDQKCIFYDKALVITAVVLRSVNDIGLCYFFQWSGLFADLKFIVNISTKDFASKLNMQRLYHFRAILFGQIYGIYRLYAIFSCLPIPQVISWISSKNLRTTITTRVVAPALLIVLSIFRFIAVLTWTFEAIISGKLYEWIVMFCFYTLYLSQVTGAIWYYAALYTEQSCWFEACAKRNKEKDCLHNYFASAFLCSRGYKADNLTTEFCSVNYEFGMFDEARQSGILQDTNSGFTRIIYGLRWGLQSLSSFGQGHQPSADVWRNIFTIIVILLGLLLFFFLLGQLQKYLQPNSINKLTFKRCLKSLKKVKKFEGWREASLIELYNCVEPVVYGKRTRIFREGDPIDEMIFVVEGRLWTCPSRDRMTGSTSIHCRNRKNDYLKAGDFCGEELLNWVQVDPYSSKFPISTKTVQAVTTTEAFVLMAHDLKNIFIKQSAALFVQLRWRFIRYLRSRRNAKTPALEANTSEIISVVTGA